MDFQLCAVSVTLPLLEYKCSPTYINLHYSLKNNYLYGRFTIVTGMKLSLWLIKYSVMKSCGEWDAILLILHLGTREKKLVSLTPRLLFSRRSSSYPFNKKPRGTPKVILAFLRKENTRISRELENMFKNKIWKRCSGSVAKMMCQGSNQ
jgi:hypothetical protein